jgi:hypothetical protein
MGELWQRELRALMPAVEQFAARKGMRADCLEYANGAERIHVEWRDGGLYKRLEVEPTYPDHLLGVAVYVDDARGWVGAVLRLLLLLSLAAAVWLTGLPTRGGSPLVWVMGSLAFIVLVLVAAARWEAATGRLQYRREFPPMEAGESVPTQLSDRLEEAWEYLQGFALDDLRREYWAARRHLREEVMPRLRAFAERRDGTMRKDHVGVWRVWWPRHEPRAGIQVSVRLYQDTYIHRLESPRPPNTHTERPSRHALRAYRVALHDLAGLERALEEAAEGMP